MKNLIILVIVILAFSPINAQHLTPPPLRTSVAKTVKPSLPYQGRTVVYHLYVTDTIVNFSGKSRRAIAVNGQIPMPTLTFTEGDTAEIYVHNELEESTSLHWHGLFLPNKEDGVPNLTRSEEHTSELQSPC